MKIELRIAIKDGDESTMILKALQRMSGSSVLTDEHIGELRLSIHEISGKIIPINCLNEASEVAPGEWKIPVKHAIALLNEIGKYCL